MTDTVAASLVAEFRSTGLDRLLSDYKKVHQATKDLGDAMDAVSGKHHSFWASLQAPAGVVADLKAAHTAIKDIHTLMGQSAPQQFANSLHTGIKDAETAWDRLASKIRGGLGSINLPGSQRGGFDLLGSALGVASGPLGMIAGGVGNVAGAGLGLLGGAAGAVGGAAMGVAGFGADQLMGGISSVASLDAARAQVAAHMGTDFAGKSKADRDKILGQVMNNAFNLSSAPETGKVDSIEALAAMDEAAKAGITDPAAMMEMAKTALQLRAAGGENKITTDNAMRLLITGKNAFGGKYSDKTVANSINGLVNATTLDISQIQSILKNAGAANVSGMPLDQYLLEAGMFAQAGTAPGQIGGGIKQLLQMSNPRSSTSVGAMEQLGLIGKDGKNNLWDAKGNIKDPASFFETVLKSTEGMNPKQMSDVLNKAFNPKAAGYLEQVLGYYKDNPDAFEKLAAQMKQQGDVAVTASTQNDNLETALRNLGDTVQNIKDKALLPILEPMKGFVNQLTKLGQDAMTGDWGAFKVDLAGLKKDLLAKLTEVKTWLNTNAPKIFETVKSGVLDVSKILFGADVTAKVQSFFTKDLPAAWNGAVAGLKGLQNFWDTTIKPLLFGTDKERTDALSSLTSVVSTGVGNFLSKDLPAFLDKNQNPIMAVGERLATALVNGFWNGFKKSDIGAGMDALTRGDMGAFLGMLNKHGIVGWGGADDKQQEKLPPWLGGGGIAGTGPQDTSKPPPGQTWADGHYEQGVWRPNLLPSERGAGPPPPPPRAGSRPDNVGAPVVVINTHPGDTNKYSVPTVAQRHSQDAENYGRLSRPRS